MAEHLNLAAACISVIAFPHVENPILPLITVAAGALPGWWFNPARAARVMTNISMSWPSSLAKETNSSVPVYQNITINLTAPETGTTVLPVMLSSSSSAPSPEVLSNDATNPLIPLHRPDTIGFLPLSENNTADLAVNLSSSNPLFPFDRDSNVFTTLAKSFPIASLLSNFFSSTAKSNANTDTHTIREKSTIDENNYAAKNDAPIRNDATFEDDITTKGGSFIKHGAPVHGDTIFEGDTFCKNSTVFRNDVALNDLVFKNHPVFKNYLDSKNRSLFQDDLLCKNDSLCHENSSEWMANHSSLLAPPPIVRYSNSSRILEDSPLTAKDSESFLSSSSDKFVSRVTKVGDDNINKNTTVLNNTTIDNSTALEDTPVAWPATLPSLYDYFPFLTSSSIFGIPRKLSPTVANIPPSSSDHSASNKSDSALHSTFGTFGTSSTANASSITNASSGFSSSSTPSTSITSSSSGIFKDFSTAQARSSAIARPSSVPLDLLNDNVSVSSYASDQTDYLPLLVFSAALNLVLGLYIHECRRLLRNAETTPALL